VEEHETDCSRLLFPQLVSRYDLPCLVSLQINQGWCRVALLFSLDIMQQVAMQEMQSSLLLLGNDRVALRVSSLLVRGSSLCVTCESKHIIAKHHGCRPPQSRK
jgi:hypothetical protein